MRRRLNIGTRRTTRTATDRHSLLTGIMLNSTHRVHARLLPEGGVSAGPSNETGRDNKINTSARSKLVTVPSRFCLGC